MNEQQMLEITQRHQSELRQFAEARRATADPAVDVKRERGSLGGIGSRFASLRQFGVIAASMASGRRRSGVRSTWPRRLSD